MFPPGVAVAFEREYGCTEREWLRDLPGAVAPQALLLSPPAQATVALGAGRLQLQWAVLPPLRIALLNMPRLKVAFRFEAVEASQRELFMKRFNLVLQRGGG